MYTHKVVLLALCQFTSTCGAIWLKLFTYYFRANQNVINAVRTTYISTSGLELRGLNFPFFASLTPIVEKERPWENQFFAHLQRVSPASIAEIFTDTALLSTEQIDIELVQNANELRLISRTPAYL